MVNKTADIGIFKDDGIDIADAVMKEDFRLLEVEIESGDCVCGKQIMDLCLSAHVIIGCLVRGNNTIIPNGRTEIREGDKLLIFTNLVFQEVEESLCI